MLTTVFKWIIRRVAMLAATLLLTLLFGELLMRAKVVLPVIQYDKSISTMPFVYPNQRAVMYVANATYRCPPLTINSDGMRGPEIDWSKKVILLLGSSETMGTGVQDDEVCSSVLDRNIQEANSDEFAVANGALGGFGPYHQGVMLERVLSQHDLSAVIVRVTISDCQFLPKTTANRGRLAGWLRQHALLFSTLSRKAAAQYQLLRNLRFMATGDNFQSDHTAYSEDLGRYQFAQHRKYWESIIQQCTNRNVPLVFVVMNPIGRDAEKILAIGLTSIASGKPNVFVASAGPSTFELDKLPVEERTAEYLKRWTLRCDPHANAFQHELFGRTVMGILEALKLVTPRPSM